jgi:DNA polymerase I-like protein with 3'-5' exonuclease and polymerase domains
MQPAALHSGPARFAAEMGVSEAEAKVALEEFKRSIPGVEKWKERVVREVGLYKLTPR